MAVAWLVIVVSVLTPRALFALAFATWSVNMTSWDLSWIRITPAVAIILIVSAILKSKTSRGMVSHKVPAVLFAPLTAGLLGLVFSPLAVSPTSSAIDSIAFVTSISAAILSAIFLPGKLVPQAAFWGLFPIILLSIVAVILGLPGAIGPAFAGVPDGRWYGVASNPNGLGLILTLWVITARAYGPRRMWLALLLATPFVIGTGSRGSLLALVAGLLAIVWVASGKESSRNVPKGLRRALLVTIIAVFAFIFAQQIGAGTDLRILSTDYALSGDASRVTVVSRAWEAALQSPWVGYGFAENSVGDVAGAHFTPVALTTRIGLAGLVIYGVTVVLLLLLPWRFSPTLAGIVFWGIASSLSEQWMYGSGTVVQAVFWFTVATLGSGLLATQRSQPGAQRVSPTGSAQLRASHQRG